MGNIILGIADVLDWVVPTYKMGIDLSPIIAFLIIIFLRRALVANLYAFGISLTSGR